MKKTIAFASIMLVGLFLLRLYAEEIVYDPITPNSTSIQANTTNSTPGTLLLINNPIGYSRLYVKACGTSATGNLIVKFSTASGNHSTTNETDTGALVSTTKITIPFTGTQTNVLSDVFNLYGCRYITVGQVENGCNGAISNMTFYLSRPSGGGNGK